MPIWRRNLRLKRQGRARTSGIFGDFAETSRKAILLSITSEAIGEILVLQARRTDGAENSWRQYLVDVATYRRNVRLLP